MKRLIETDPKLLETQKSSPLYSEIYPVVESICDKLGFEVDFIFRKHHSRRQLDVELRYAIIYVLLVEYVYKLTTKQVAIAFAYCEHTVIVHAKQVYKDHIFTKDERFLNLLNAVRSEFIRFGKIYPKTCRNCEHYEPELFACCFRTPYEIENMPELVRSCGPDFSCDNFKLDANEKCA